MNIPTRKYSTQYPNIHSYFPKIKLSNLPAKTRINTFLIDLSGVARMLKLNMKRS